MHQQPCVDPFPLLSLPDLVLQHVLTFLSLLERKAIRGTCRKLCKVASAAVRHFHVEKGPGDAPGPLGDPYLQYRNLHEKFPNVQVITVSDELVRDSSFSILVTLTLCKLKNLTSIILLNSSMALSSAGIGTLGQCRQIKQLVLAPPYVSKGPLMTANTEAIMKQISQLPGLTHLLLLPSKQQDRGASGAGGTAAAAIGAAGLGGHQSTALNGRPRDWQLNDAALQCLGALHGLVQLELGCDSAGLLDLGCLAAMSNLRRLALRRLSLEAGDGLNVLTCLPALRSLSLVDGAIGEDSLAHVGRCTKLTRLELQGCYRLREAGLTHLIHLHQLACFRCSLPLTESGLAIIVAATGSRITLLEADSIEISMAEAHPAVAAAVAAAGVHHLAVAPAAGNALHANAIGGGAAVVNSGPQGPERTGSAALAGQLGPQLPGLRTLVLRRLPSSSPQLWQLAPNLTSLVVWGEANNAGLTRAFSGHCALQRLVLSCEATSDAGLAAISSLTGLRDLTLYEGANISPQRLITVVQRLPCLQVLQLSNMRNLGDESLAHLVAATQQLQVLGLQEPGLVSDQGFALLAGLPKLNTLWIDCCKLSMAVLMALACYPSLCLLEVHQSHPEADTLGLQQLELLSRVKGPKLEVVVREGARTREELIQPLFVPGGVLRAHADLSAEGWSASGLQQGEAAEPSVGFGAQELVLEHGLMIGGHGPARALMGHGSWQVGLVAAPLAGGDQDDNAWPDIFGLQL